MRTTAMIALAIISFPLLSFAAEDRVKYEKWILWKDTDPMTDTRTFRARLDPVEASDDDVCLWVRHENGDLDIFFHLDDYMADNVQMQVRVGDGEPTWMEFYESTDNTALFVKTPTQKHNILRTIKDEERIVIRYQPYRSGWKTAVFETGGGEKIASGFMKLIGLRW